MTRKFHIHFKELLLDRQNLGTVFLHTKPVVFKCLRPAGAKSKERKNLFCSLFPEWFMACGGGGVNTEAYVA